jgi:Cd2+/Zn2+-exporting ATPase
MDCADEVAILRKELGPLVGSPERLAFDVLRAKMIVSAAANVTSQQIAAAVANTGMRAELWTDVQRGAGQTSFWQRRGRTVLTAASGLLSLAAFAVHASLSGSSSAFGSEGIGAVDTEAPPVAIALYLAGIICGAWFVAPRAWNAVRRLRPDMNLLMTIAVVGAAIIGEWFEAAAVSFLFALSLALESWSVGRARRAVEALLAIAPPTARVLSVDGSAVETPAVDVPVGARILVKPGDRIPLDGAVLKGVSTVNQAPITGEGMPVDKAPGSEVFAGTINGDGALEVDVTRLAGETTLAQIIRMVEEAQTRRAPSEQWVDRFALIYTPVIFATAILVAAIPPLLLSEPASVWFYRALVLLVIGCPCALVISTPVSVVASLAAAARQGVLVKGGAFIEIPARLKAVALDKTGTLTLGAPTVTTVVALAGHSEAEVLQSAAALEEHSDHPLAKAIVAHARKQGVPSSPSAENVQAVQGRGITGDVGGRRYWLGSHRYLEELRQETPDVHREIEALSSAGQTVVVVGTDDHVCGLIALADAVRPESVGAVQRLHAAGIKHIVMLTGDNRATAFRIATETGIDIVKAEMLPSDKVGAVEELVRQFGAVAMIGDGVNDAPAMGRATVGIAMGAAGSDAAVEAADIALMSDDLSKLPWLVEHSRRTLGVIRQNVIVSLGVKVLFVVLTFSGAASLWAAIAADMGISLAVIANALRLLRVRS